MADSVQALRDAVASLAAMEGIHAHLCDGDPSTAVAWSSRSQVTVRLSAPADDEIWVLAGAGLLARVIADSEGGFEIEPIVEAILEGRAVEMLGAAAGTDRIVPLGWRVGTASGGLFAGGAEPGPSVIALAITGAFGESR